MARNRIVLDSGALTALAKGHEALRVAARKALEAGASVVVPTVVVAESTTNGGAGDAAVNRALKVTRIVDCDLTTARAAAALRFSVGARAGTVDAIVVATADQTRGSIIVTGDPSDLRMLAAVRDVSAVVPLA